ncbi:MAG: hypothetical protein E7199_03560 [Schwartzia succinivorans]|nr:hypothetical protein [Schwartzia succinivorans]
MKLRKKRRYYRRQSVTPGQILAALEQRKVEIIYSWGAFGLHGLGCRIDDVAFRFDFETNPHYSLGRYLTEHTEEEVAEKIAKEINGRGRLPKRTRKYCIEFLSSVQ